MKTPIVDEFLGVVQGATLQLRARSRPSDGNLDVVVRVKTIRKSRLKLTNLNHAFNYLKPVAFQALWVDRCLQLAHYPASTPTAGPSPTRDTNRRPPMQYATAKPSPPAPPVGRSVAASSSEADAAGGFRAAAAASAQGYLTQKSERAVCFVAVAWTSEPGGAAAHVAASGGRSEYKFDRPDPSSATKTTRSFAAHVTDPTRSVGSS